jgi:hypothetical protein
MPTEAAGGCANTAVGIRWWRTGVGRFPHRVSLADRDRRERDAAGDVTHGVDVCNVRTRPLVDHDRAAGVELDSRGTQAEPLGGRIAADRGHRDVDLDLALRGDDVVAAPDQGRAGEEVDPVRRQVVGDGLANLRIEATQHERIAVDQGYLRPQAGKDVRELDRDVSPAHDRDPAGERWQVEGFVRGDPFPAGPPRPPPRRDQQMRRGDRPARDLDRMRVEDPRAPGDDLGARLAQPVGVGVR